MFIFFLPRIKHTAESGMSETTKFMMSLSIDVKDGRDRLAAIRKQALSTCCNKRWAGLMDMLALSSVIRHTIYSVYPDCSPAIRPLFHGPIIPRMGSLPNSTTCYIMWTRDSALNNNGPFQPNHFVPLLTTKQKKGPATYAEIMKHGKKHPLKTAEMKRSEERIGEPVSLYDSKNLSPKRKLSESKTAKETQPTDHNRSQKVKRTDNCEQEKPRSARKESEADTEEPTLTHEKRSYSSEKKPRAENILKLSTSCKKEEHLSKKIWRTGGRQPLH